jgi:hypothetical protein
MKNKFEFVLKTKSATKGCELMDWLNENEIQFEVTLGEPKQYVFNILANRLNVATVERYLNEVWR